MIRKFSRAYFEADRRLRPLSVIERLATFWENVPEETKEVMDPPLIDLNSSAVDAQDAIYDLPADEMEMLITKHIQAVLAEITEKIQDDILSSQASLTERAFVATSLIENPVLWSKAIANRLSEMNIPNSNLTSSIEQWTKNEWIETVDEAEGKFRLSSAGKAKRKRMIKVILNKISPD